MILGHLQGCDQQDTVQIRKMMVEQGRDRSTRCCFEQLCDIKRRLILLMQRKV